MDAEIRDKVINYLKNSEQFKEFTEENFENLANKIEESGDTQLVSTWADNGYVPDNLPMLLNEIMQTE